MDVDAVKSWFKKSHIHDLPPPAANPQTHRVHKLNETSVVNLPTSTPVPVSVCGSGPVVYAVGGVGLDRLKMGGGRIPHRPILVENFEICLQNDDFHKGNCSRCKNDFFCLWRATSSKVSKTLSKPAAGAKILEGGG